MSVLETYKAPEGKPRSLEQNFSIKFMKFLNWKLRKQEEIVKYVLEIQKEAIESRDVYKLNPLDMKSVGEKVGVHQTSAGRLTKNMIISMDGIELPISELIINKKSGLASIMLESYILDIAREYGVQSLSDIPCSDEKIAGRYLSDHQISISRRLVNKVRNKLIKEGKTKILELFRQ